MALIRTLMISTTTFERMQEKLDGFRQTELLRDVTMKPSAPQHEAAKVIQVYLSAGFFF